MVLAIDELFLYNKDRNSSDKWTLELYVQPYPYTLLVYSWKIAVGESTDIVDTQYLEDVFHPHGYLYVRCRGHIVVAVILVREFEQCTSIQRVGAVLVAQVAV